MYGVREIKCLHRRASAIVCRKLGVSVWTSKTVIFIARSHVPSCHRACVNMGALGP